MASRAIIVKYLAVFHELFPTREVTEHTAAAWEFACLDMTDAGFGYAADRLLKEQGRTFFPTPNELRSYLSTAVDHAHRTKLLNPAEEAVRDGVLDWYQNGGPERLRAENAAKNAIFAGKFPDTWKGK